LSNFTSVVIPYSGLSLINGAISGLNTLQFTSVKIGNGVYTGQENLANSKNLKSIKQIFSIESVKKKDDEYIIVRCIIKNDSVTESFNITEIGIFAKDSSNEEKLIGITINTGGEPFPAFSLAPRTISMDLYIQVAGASNITFTVDGSPGIYVTTERFEELTAEDIGAAEKSHKHKTSDITDFPTALPADGGDADTVGGKSANDFRLTDVSIVSNQDYDTFPNGTVYASTGCGNAPDDYCIVETNVASNNDGYQKAYCVNTRITHNRKRATVDGWTSWNDDRDGGNAYTVGGKTEAQLIKYDDLFAYTDGRIISSVLWINTETFDDSMRKTYGIVPGTPDSPPGMGYGVRLPCVAYDKNGVLVTVIQLDPVENQGKVWTNLYRKHLGSWTGWRANNDGGNASTLGGLASHDFVRYSGNSVLARKQGTSKEGGEIVFEKADDSTLKGNPFLDLFNNTIRFVTPSSRGGTAVIELLIDEPLKANNTIAVFTAGTTDITPGVTNLGKNQIYIMYE
jgi:hypothetical protein